MWSTFKRLNKTEQNASVSFTCSPFVNQRAQIFDLSLYSIRSSEVTQTICFSLILSARTSSLLWAMETKKPPKWESCSNRIQQGHRNSPSWTRRFLQRLASTSRKWKKSSPCSTASPTSRPLRFRIPSASKTLRLRFAARQKLSPKSCTNWTTCALFLWTLCIAVRTSSPRHRARSQRRSGRTSGRSSQNWKRNCKEDNFKKRFSVFVSLLFLFLFFCYLFFLDYLWRRTNNLWNVLFTLIVSVLLVLIMVLVSFTLFWCFKMN